MTESSDSTDVENALVAVYHGPLEEFISRRDALAKQLRAAKRREDADRVKALRKPSRTAWVLDNIVHEEPASLDQLADAITAAGTVQSGAELRSAMETVRTAVRAVAAAGARVAIRAEHPIDASQLVIAVNAVIGDANAFRELRAGRLVEVPDAGGLDMLTALPTIAPPPPSAAPAARPLPPVTPPPPADEPPNAAPSAADLAREAELAKARADLTRAESSLADARGHSERVAHALREAEAKLAVTERALEQVRDDAAEAAARVQEAEGMVAAARARLSRGER
jgi:septal ring factor EnvC (AmiA/AmiB activator)